ncbi:hypothetical protein ACLB2K_052459 [Fragaria x ananassa]
MSIGAFVYVKTCLLAAGLWKVIEAGGDPPKLEDDEEKFDAWSRQNAKALHVIHITCGSGIFPFISETTSARVAWDMLARKFLLVYYYFGKGKDERSDSPTPVYGGRGVHEENIGTGGGGATDGMEAFFGFFKNVKAVDDWDEVMEFLKRHPEAVRMRYQKNGYTGLHIAAGTGAAKAVEEMVQLMEEEDLEIEDNTVRVAVSCSNWEVANYLYRLTPKEALKPENGPDGADIIITCIQRKQFGIKVEDDFTSFDAISIDVQTPEIDEGNQMDLIIESDLFRSGWRYSTMDSRSRSGFIFPIPSPSLSILGWSFGLVEMLFGL